MTDILPVLILIFFCVTIIFLRSRNAQKSRHTWQSIHKTKPQRSTIPTSSVGDRIASAGLKTIIFFVLFYCIDTFWTYFLVPDAKLAVAEWVSSVFDILIFAALFIVIFILIFVFSEVLALRSELEKLK